jgi:Polysaccharide lyase
MKDSTNEPALLVMANERRSVSWLALMLLLTGWALPALCWAYWLPQALLWASCAAVLLAFGLGIVAWQRPLAKFVVIGAVAFALVGVGAVRHGLPTYPLQIWPTATWMQPLATQWITQSAAKPYSIRTDSSRQQQGEDSLRFELRAGDTWVDQTFLRTFRAEVTSQDFPPAGVEQWYALSVFFPSDFPIEKNRLVFAQWKEREGFLAVGLSPSLAFRFVDGQFSIRLRHSPEKVIRDADDVKEINVFKTRSFPLGQWQRFVVQAKWSCREDGLVNVWWNGRQIVEYRGPVGYDQPFAPKLKFGLYRDATEKTYVAYFNRVLTGDHAEDVGFDPATAVRASTD